MEVWRDRLRGQRLDGEGVGIRLRSGGVVKEQGMCIWHDTNSVVRVSSGRINKTVDNFCAKLKTDSRSDEYEVYCKTHEGSP